MQTSKIWISKTHFVDDMRMRMIKPEMASRKAKFSICTQHVLIMVNSISKVLCDLLLTCGMCNYPCIPSQPSEMPLLRKIDSSTWMYFDKLLLCPPLHGGSCFSPLRRPVHRGGGVIHPNPIIATASPPMRR